MTHCLRLLPLFLILLICSLFNGCSDDKPEPEIPGSGDSEVTLTEFSFPMDMDGTSLERIRSTSVTLKIKDLATNRLFQEETTFARFGNYLRFKLKNGLPDGRFMLLGAVCHPTNGDPDYQAAMGMTVAVTKGELTVTSSYNKKYKFYGSGTAEDPFVIGCEEDLEQMKEHMNGDNGYTFEGMYFRQESSLNLRIQDYTTGWYPIAAYSNIPFMGTYDGGGHEIQSLWITAENENAKGLFGFALGATFRNITFVDTRFAVDGFAGSLLGAAITEGKTSRLTTVEHCRVNSGSLTGYAGVGGLVGGVDELTALLIRHCYNEASVQGAVGAGGLVGLGVVSSLIQMDSCENKGTISALADEDLISGIGGLVGAADTLMITFSENSGTLEAPIDDVSRAIGGIAGSSGQGIFALCTNKGVIRGGRGVGGILGSTVVQMEGTEENDENAIYNSTLCVGCVNEKEVSAYQMSGGLIGESQATVINSYNTGAIHAYHTNAGGITGSAPTLIAENCLNTGTISGAGNVGGIAAVAQLGQVIGSYNFGEVATSYADAVIGGVIGYAASSVSIHYSGNYGLIKHTGSSGVAGGITGHLGIPRELSTVDEVSLALSVVSVISGAAYTVGSWWQEAAEVAGCVRTGLFLGRIPGWAYTGAASLSERIHAMQQEGDRSIEPVKFEARIRQATGEMMANQQQLFSSKLNAFALQHNNYSGMINRYGESQQTFSGQMLRDDAFFASVNDKLVTYKEDRAGAYMKKLNAVKTTLKVIKGVATVCSIAAFAGPKMFKIAAKTAVKLGKTGAYVGGALGIHATLTDYEQNASVIEQSFNHGQLSIGSKVYGGGLVGMQNDFAAVRNSFNTGSLEGKEASDYHGGVIGKTGSYAKVYSSVNYAKWKNPVSSNPNSSCEVYYLADQSNTDGGRTADQLRDPQTFLKSKFLDARYWTLDANEFPTHTGRSYFEDNIK